MERMERAAVFRLNDLNGAKRLNVWNVWNWPQYQTSVVVERLHRPNRPKQNRNFHQTLSA